MTDPVRPKNDKGSILADSILMLSEIRSEIARMKGDHLALVDESRDVSSFDCSKGMLCCILCNFRY